MESPIDTEDPGLNTDIGSINANVQGGQSGCLRHELAPSISPSALNPQIISITEKEIGALI